jgi:preprotein translocase subunit YajC
VRPSLTVLVHHVLAVGSTGTSSGSTSSNGLLSTLPLLVIFGAIGYFLLIRPQRRRQRQTQQTAAELAPGVEVLTRHGQFATVVAVDDDSITLEVAPGVQSRFLREAIARVVTPAEPDLAMETSADPPDIEMIPDSPPATATGTAGPPSPSPTDLTGSSGTTPAVPAEPDVRNIDDGPPADADRDGS